MSHYLKKKKEPVCTWQQELKGSGVHLKCAGDLTRHCKFINLGHSGYWDQIWNFSFVNYSNV